MSSEKLDCGLFAFVLMPFSEDFKDYYELAIKPACAAVGIKCGRVDEQQFSETILARIYDQIGKADIIIADMTGRNPNVFYEVGYAHAMGKRVVLLTQEVSDMPFDLASYKHIVYRGQGHLLKPELIETLEWCIQNPLKKKTLAQMRQTIARLRGDIELLEVISSPRDYEL